MFRREKYSKDKYEEVENVADTGRPVAVENPGLNVPSGEYEHKWDEDAHGFVPDYSQPQYKWIWPDEQLRYFKSREKLAALKQRLMRKR